MKVTIIIPFYNVSQYVERSLLSALNQTYENVEYVCVNDGSTDDSLQKIRMIAERHKRKEQIIIVEHTTNRGIAVARNTGIDYSTGDYIYFLDSDDEMPKDAIEVLISANLDHSADIVLGDFDVTGIKRSIFPPLTIPDGCIKTNKEIFDCFLAGKWPDMTCNKLEKLSLIRSYNMKFKEGILHEDALWAFELAMNSSSMLICHNITYIYHIRQDSITRKKGDKNFKSLLIVLNRIMNYSLELDLFNKHHLLVEYIADFSIYFYKELLRSEMCRDYIKDKTKLLNQSLKMIPKKARRGSSICSKIKLLAYRLPFFWSILYVKIILFITDSHGQNRRS